MTADLKFYLLCAGKNRAAKLFKSHYGFRGLDLIPAFAFLHLYGNTCKHTADRSCFFLDGFPDGLYLIQTGITAPALPRSPLPV